MKGNTLEEFIDDMITMGGPEKEFIFRGKRYFLETLLPSGEEKANLYIDEIGGSLERTYTGNSYLERFQKFENDPIFDGLTLYEAEKEITVVFG